MKLAARAVALAAMASTFCASPVLADESASAPTSSKDATSAMRVVVDPETGEARAPTDAELKAQLERENSAASARSLTRASAKATSQSNHVLPAEKVVQRHSNGMVSVRMSQQSLSALKATTQADGKVDVAHTDETRAPVAVEEK